MNKDDAKLSVGALVRLKSGGPKLSVRSVENEEVIVEWFEGEKLKSHSFQVSQLELAPAANVSELEIVRRIAFTLAQGARQIPGFENVDSNSIDELTNHLLKGATENKL